MEASDGRAGPVLRAEPRTCCGRFHPMSPGIQPTGEASPQATTIRAAAPSDATAVAAIYNHYVTKTLVTFEEEPVAAAEIARRMADVRSESLPWWSPRRAATSSDYAYATHLVDPRRLSLSADDHGSSRSRARGGRGIGSKSSTASFPDACRPAASVSWGSRRGIGRRNDASVAFHEKFGLHGKSPSGERSSTMGCDVGYWQRTL